MFGGHAPEPSLDELLFDASAIRELLAARVLNLEDQALMDAHLRSLESSITFMERMGQ